MIDDNLIYDLGAHKGEDTGFYLKKGFNVVAIEAVPEFCIALGEQFSREVATGKLKILNLAVAKTPGEIDFYVNTKHSVWGTANLGWAKRNQMMGAGSFQKTTVKAERLTDIMREHGVPRYCKIDIEGNDFDALSSLECIPAPPRFVSIESEKENWDDLVKEFELLRRLGYSRFKIIDQRLVPLQQTLEPATEGSFETHRFEEGSSGLFGTELPGRWMDMFEALEVYKGIFRGYALAGDAGIFWGRKSLFRMLGGVQEALVRAAGRKDYRFPTFPPASWYDTHAAR
ncbi:FkbM family methyltransferase [Bradyrhizobium sp. LB11.1]|jgi:FkbM family methyltransferase|uniref:FkbM family methyltransferase n=1 Tax=Bradyrhizobium sp. LB11.1 TaxID=3156326 RepID=UPI00339A5DFD